MGRPPLKAIFAFIAIASFAILVGVGARPASAAEPEIHYAPVENLEHIDLSLIRSATKAVDIAAYSLTDWAIIAALKEARARVSTPEQNASASRSENTSIMVASRPSHWGLFVRG